MTSSNYNHMNHDDRIVIEDSLNIPGITLKQISSGLGRDGKTIREEIKKHRYIFIAANRKNKCGKQEICEKRRLCTHCVSGLCKFCSHDNCNQLCDEFTPEPACQRLERFPFVCSCCDRLSSCKQPKYFYKAQKAQAERDLSVREWKSGPKKSVQDMKQVVEVFERGIPNGIAPDILIHTNDLNISTSTAYRYIHHRHMGAIMPIDLKRAVKYKKQDRSKPRVTPIDYDYLNNRRYEDFCDGLLIWNSSVNIWEMDTVLGPKGTKKCALSLLHRKSNLQLYFLLNECTMLEVQRVFDGMKTYLGSDLFRQTFEIILTDNGSEFHDPISLETDPNSGEKLCSIFFCRPRHSDQKGKCEKNHEHFREIIPKGFSMDGLTSKDMQYISGMVNNYPRKELGYKSPYQLSHSFLPKKVLALNKLTYIHPNTVKLTPFKK